MSLNEYLHKLPIKEIVGNTLTINNYGIENNFFSSPTINDDVSYLYILKIDPESQPDTNNESEYCSRVNDEENSICFPIITNSEPLLDEKCIHYSLKDILYFKRNQIDIIDLFNKVLQEIISLKTALESCNSVFTTDVAGTTPMATISTTLTPALQQSTQNLNKILSDFEDFYK